LPTASVDQSDLQGNILCGYGNSFGHALYAFLHVERPEAGRSLLAELAREVTNALPWREGIVKPHSTLNVALTHSGLGALGVRSELLDGFPREFQAGMAARAADLGDVGDSAPERWDKGLRPGRPHLLVTITGQTPDARDGEGDRLRKRVAAAGSGISIVHEQHADVLGRPKENEAVREHFGFADGLSQPTIKDPRAGPHDRAGRGTPRRLGLWDDVAPGEFVLGYEDEDGLLAESPPEPLRTNGSFMVVRKLYQDVAAFDSYLSTTAAASGMSEDLLAAKVVGRWRSGAPLTLAPEQDDPGLTIGGAREQELNDFRYGTDLAGMRCPVGAHIRRANPRDALGWRGLLSKRHRIIRRGMPYGPRFEDRPGMRDADRGLMFICFQASISRQFEFIQAHWLVDGDAFGLGSEQDPLVAADPGGRMTIQGRSPTFLASLPSFVATRGGEYFFVPGIAALLALAADEA
jgi:Dyp-type peroxidase family